MRVIKVRCGNSKDEQKNISGYKWTIQKAIEEGFKGRGRRGATTFDGSRVVIIGGGA